MVRLLCIFGGNSQIGMEIIIVFLNSEHIHLFGGRHCGRRRSRRRGVLPGGRGYGLVLPRVVVVAVVAGMAVAASALAVGSDRVVAVAVTASSRATMTVVGVGCRTVSGLFTQGGRSLLRRLRLHLGRSSLAHVSLARSCTWFLLSTWQFKDQFDEKLRNPLFSMKHQYM